MNRKNRIELRIFKDLKSLKKEKMVVVVNHLRLGKVQYFNFSENEYINFIFEIEMNFSKINIDKKRNKALLISQAREIEIYALND